MAFYEEEVWLEWIDLLSENEYVIVDNFLSEELYSLIARFLQEKLEENDFEKASIGTGSENQVISEIRGDYTYWLDSSRDVGLHTFFQLINELIGKLNRYCYLSLSDYELHLAHYPEGSFYKRHIDQFRDRSNRMITLIIYFNDSWKPGDGGELKMFLDKKEKVIEPLANRLVLFKSAEIPHEVLITQKARLSLTGWLLYQPTGLGYLFG